MAVLVQRAHNMNGGQCQLTRSLERILEEAHFSGELKLSNRKLKDFPKTAATKYNLSDTVIADLSRNRFCEMPEDITSYAFLETLLLYHNTIRSISQSVKGLNSLTYLDLRSNHLTALPRELCFLPIQVLLVANNRLTSLPDELGRMEKLTDLDASCNQLTSLPMRIGDLTNLRSLSLRSNQLVYLPREITYLMLVSLNLSCNKITSLPVEIRQMTTLVELNLENNPLTSPPASLCVRGLVHVFKFLEIQAMKEDKGKMGITYDGLTTLRRAPRHTHSLTDTSKGKRTNVDSGYSTSDGIDKRWSQDAIRTVAAKSAVIKPKPSKLLDSTDSNSKVTNKENNLGSNDFNVETNLVEKFQTKSPQNIDSSNSESTSPEDDCMSESQKSMERNKNLGNIQTYREYKEALKQQRNQDYSVYRNKGQGGGNNPEANGILNSDSFNDLGNGNSNSCNVQSIVQNKKMHSPDDSVPTVLLSKKPVQKVIPSRSQTPLYHVNDTIVSSKDSAENGAYVKPTSPTKCNGSMPNKIPTSPKSPATQKISNVKPSLTKSRNVTWKSDIPAEKLSFTMRREFDKQKEETELLSQLRMIIETKLKMNMPDDISSALTDGVVLCHLANYVRPRSVGSIHVPSPGVPKLTMARCRRNVDNFLEACRKIGVDEESICSCEDILNAANDDDSCTPSHDDDLRRASAIFRTVTTLLDIDRSNRQQKQQLLRQDESNSATNASRIFMMNYDDTDENVSLNSLSSPKCSVGLQGKNNGNLNSNVFYTKSSGNFDSTQEIERNLYLYNKTANDVHFTLNNIEEEVEYEEYYGERDNFKINGFDNENYSNCDNVIGLRCEITEVNNLNRVTIYNRVESDLTVDKDSMNINTLKNIPDKILTKRIEFFEQNIHVARGKFEKCLKNCTLQINSKDKLTSHNSTVLSIILSCTFIVTFLLLIFFPLPN